MDFEVTNKSTAISSFICYVMSSGGDSYRTRVTRDGGGTHSIIFTTPNRSLTSLYLRINADVTTAGTEYTVDNFVVHKYTDPIETVQFTTDFSSAVKSGVNVSSDGIVFQPNSGSNGLSVSGTTDKRLLVTNTSADESKVRAELELEGGHQYVLRYEVGQDIAEKRVLLDLSYRVGTTWNLSETRGLFTTGSGVQMVNFFLPSDANAVRVSLARSAGSNAYDGVGTPYTIDNFSISKLEVSATRTTTICEDVEEDGQIVLGGYRYGFNGKENDNEIKGEGNQQDYGMRIYDARLGRFLSVDPLFQSFPWNSVYAYAENSPILFKDLDGLERIHYQRTFENGKPVLTFMKQEDLVEWQWNPKLGGTKLGFQLWQKVKNPRVEYIVHQEREGTWEEFDKVQFVTYDETWTYDSYKSMVDDKDGEYGGEKNMSYLRKGLQAAKEENMAVGGGGGLNWGNTFYKSAARVTRESVQDKLKRYLLNLEHPVGGAKAKWFKEALGFTKENINDLASQIVFDPKKAIQTGTNKQGALYKQMIEIKGANGRVIETQFNFIKHNNGDVMLVGAIPTNK